MEGSRHVLSREAAISYSYVVYRPDAYSHGHGTDSMLHPCFIALRSQRKELPTRGDAVLQAWTMVPVSHESFS